VAISAKEKSSTGTQQMAKKAENVVWSLQKLNTPIRISNCHA